MMKTVTDVLIAQRLSHSPGDPLITHYDRDTGGRIELSVVSTVNWAAKIAGVLRDDLGLTAGDTVEVDLPAHWLTVGVLLGSWWAGLSVVTPEPDTDSPETGVEVAAVFASYERLEKYQDAAELLAVSTDPMGRSLEDCGRLLEPGVVDLIADARIQPDSFIPDGGLPDAPIIDGTQLEDAASLTGHQIAPGARVLLDARSSSARAFAQAVTAILAVQGSIVAVSGQLTGALADTAATERADLQITL